MRKVILLHGCCDQAEFRDDQYPSSSNSHWLPWMQKKLNQLDILSEAPEMPRPFAPNFEAWKRVFDQYSITPETVLVGHSCGAGFLLRWLGNGDQRIAKLILVAPYLDPLKTARRGKEFLSFKIEPSIVDRVEEMHVLYSKDEAVPGVKETVEIIIQQFPAAKVHTFADMGHFTFRGMGRHEFPELLDLVR